MYLLESPRRGDAYKYSKTYVFLKNTTSLSMENYTIRWFLCRPNWRYKEFCCYNEYRYREG